jgi:magnesium transporter
MSHNIFHKAPSAPNAKTIISELSAAPAADAADLIDSLPGETAVVCFTHLSLKRQAAILGYLPLQRQVELLSAMDPAKARAVFAALPGDEQTDLYTSLAPDVQEKVLRALDEREKTSLLTLASYPEGSAGSVATADFTFVTQNMTAEEAINSIRKQAMEKETIYVVYILDADGRLLGTVSLRELIVADPGDLIAHIMRGDPVSLNAGQSRKEAADLIQRYDLLALPVVDDDGRMLGIVTVDDAMDVAEEEDTSNLARFGGISVNTEDLDLLSTSLPRMFTARFFWLAVLTLIGVLTSNLVAGPEELLSKAVILAAFLAPIIDMGGNTGSQTATLVIRGMALGHIRLRFRDIWFVMRRDLPVALALGVTIAALEALMAFVSKGVGLDVILVVGLSMLTVTVVGSLFGLLLPFAAKRIGADPATLSSPLITSVMDLVGVIIYFAFAYTFLGAHYFS